MANLQETISSQVESTKQNSLKLETINQNLLKLENQEKLLFEAIQNNIIHPEKAQIEHLLQQQEEIKK